MSDLLSKSEYLIRRQGLAISGKYKVFEKEGKQALLFIEEKTKWFPPSTVIHFYTDEKKKQEFITLKDRPQGKTDEFDIFDAANGGKIGAFVVDVNNVSEIFKDVWVLLDEQDRPIGKVCERKLLQSLARTLITHAIPQNMEIMMGEIVVAELHQTVKPASYELVLDFNKDVSNLLDHRLGIAAGILVALHQGRETD